MAVGNPLVPNKSPDNFVTVLSNTTFLKYENIAEPVSVALLARYIQLYVDVAL